MTWPEVSIIIPVWNHLDDLTLPLLEHLENDGDVVSYAEVIVSDDGSTDETHVWDTYPSQLWVRIVHHSANRGFATACNLGAEIATTPVLVFLNNDTRPTLGWLPPLLDALASGAGMAGSHIVMPEGERWHAAETLGVTGASFATPRALWEQLGGFDTAAGFVHAGEELDYGFRAAAAGYPVVLVPDSVVLHRVGVSSQDQPAEWRQRHYERAYDLLVARYGSTWWDAWRAQLQIAVPAMPAEVVA